MTDAAAVAALTDLSTIKLTEGRRDIVLDFSEARPSAVNGIAAYWIRVRISGGGYGEPAKYINDAAGWRFIPPRYVLPSITAIRVSYSHTRDFDLTQADRADGLATSGGKIYMADRAGGRIVQLNNDGSFNQTVTTGIRATAVATNSTTRRLKTLGTT